MVVYGAEVEQFTHEGLLVFPFRLAQVRFARNVARGSFGIRFDYQVGFHAGRGDSRAENDSFETSAAAQCHVYLPVRESRSRIDDDAIEGQPLALVDRYGPRELQRILGKGAEDVFLYFFCFFIDRVLDVLPFDSRDGDVFSLILAAHEDFVTAKTGDFSDLAVEIAFFRREVIPDEHHLRAILELQRFLRWIRRFREVAHDFSFERPQSWREGFQSLDVQVIG